MVDDFPWSSDLENKGTSFPLKERRAEENSLYFCIKLLCGRVNRVINSEQTDITFLSVRRQTCTFIVKGLFSVLKILLFFTNESIFSEKEITNKLLTHPQDRLHSSIYSESLFGHCRTKNVVDSPRTLSVLKDAQSNSYMWPHYL